MSFIEKMILEDGSPTAQETEIFWLAKGWASHGSAAGHQAWGTSDRVKVQTVSSPDCGARAMISTSCEGELSDGERAQLKAASAPQPAATKHHSPVKSLRAYRPNQAPIKDTPSSTLLFSLASLLPNINNELVNQLCPVCCFDQAKKIKSLVLLYFIVQIWFLSVL